MSSTVAQHVTVEPLNPVLGAHVRNIDVSAEIGPETARVLRQALYRYSVLCIHAPGLSTDDQIRLAAVFGKADGWESGGQRQFEDGMKRPRPGVMFVSNLKEDGRQIGSHPDGEMHFHSDGAHRDSPYIATTLYALKLPSRGGETRFASMHAAYDDLPEAIKDRIDDLSAQFVYDVRAMFREQTDETDPSLSRAVHPLVAWHPESGRPALYLSRLMTRNIIGLPRAESDALLDQLITHCEQRRYIYEHQWQVGDLLIWDNRSVNHARNDFPADEQRHLRRITVSQPD